MPTNAAAEVDTLSTRKAPAEVQHPQMPRSARSPAESYRREGPHLEDHPSESENGIRGRTSQRRPVVAGWPDSHKPIHHRTRTHLNMHERAFSSGRHEARGGGRHDAVSVVRQDYYPGLALRG